MWVCMCLYLYLCFCVCVYLYICECFCICVCVPLIYQICSFHKMIFNPFLHVVKIGNCITHYLRIIAIILYVRCGSVRVCGGGVRGHSHRNDSGSFLQMLVPCLLDHPRPGCSKVTRNQHIIYTAKTNAFG